MGAEIVLGDIPVLHEIYKNAATYVNCHKPDVNIDELLEKNKVSERQCRMYFQVIRGTGQPI